MNMAALGSIRSIFLMMEQYFPFVTKRGQVIFPENAMKPLFLRYSRFLRPPYI